MFGNLGKYPSFIHMTIDYQPMDPTSVIQETKIDIYVSITIPPNTIAKEKYLITTCTGIPQTPPTNQLQME